MNNWTAPQGTAVVGYSAAYKGLYPLEATMAPICSPILRRLAQMLFGRWAIVELEGNCLAPQVTDRFAIVDAIAEIRRGDLISLGVRDFHTAFAATKGQDGFVKLFRGINREAGIIETECLTPPLIIHCGLSNVLYAHRVRATAPTWGAAIRLLWHIRFRA